MSFSALDVWCALSESEQRMLEHLCDPGYDDEYKAELRKQSPRVARAMRNHPWGRLLNEDGSPTALAMAVVKESPDWPYKDEENKP